MSHHSIKIDDFQINQVSCVSTLEIGLIFSGRSLELNAHYSVFQEPLNFIEIILLNHVPACVHYTHLSMHSEFYELQSPE